MSTRLVPAPYVRSVVHGDRTVLLDLLRERYYSLDEVGTRVWAMLRDDADVSAIVARLGEEFDASPEQLTADVTTLLHHLAHDLKVVIEAESRKPPRAPSALACALTLVAATLALRLTGLRRSLMLAERAGRGKSAAADPPAEFLADVVRKVDTAAAFFPGRARCLEQSLALFMCLRRAGVRAELRIGVQPYPFAAHAWVEHRGELVGESYDRVGKFVPFDRLLEAV